MKPVNKTDAAFDFIVTLDRMGITSNKVHNTNYFDVCKYLKRVIDEHIR